MSPRADGFASGSHRLVLLIAQYWPEKVTGKPRTGANRIRTGATYNKAVRRLQHDRGEWS